MRLFFRSLDSEVSGFNFVGFFFNSSGILYMLFALLLGAVCTREALLSDYMIASKASKTKMPYMNEIPSFYT